MRPGLLAATIALMMLAWPAHAQGAMSRTNPSPRAVAEQMRECFDTLLVVTDISESNGMPAVAVTTTGGAFAIKEISVLRSGRAAVLLFTRNPDFALLHLTVLNSGQGADFERRAVDCFYGAYIGRDAI